MTPAMRTFRWKRTDRELFWLRSFFLPLGSPANLSLVIQSAVWSIPMIRLSMVVVMNTVHLSFQRVLLLVGSIFVLTQLIWPVSYPLLLVIIIYYRVDWTFILMIRTMTMRSRLSPMTERMMMSDQTVMKVALESLTNDQWNSRIRWTCMSMILLFSFLCLYPMCDHLRTPEHTHSHHSFSRSTNKKKTRPTVIHTSIGFLVLLHIACQPCFHFFSSECVGVFSFLSQNSVCQESFPYDVTTSRNLKMRFTILIHVHFLFWKDKRAKDRQTDRHIHS